MTSIKKTKLTSKNMLPCGRPLIKTEVSVSKKKELFKKAIEQLNVYSAEKRLNRSEAREKILETIVGDAQHFTALELLEKLQTRHPDIGKATLYRNLPVLIESGVLQEGPSDLQGQNRYELSGGEHHDHIVCNDCRHIFEFHDDVIEKRQDLVASELKFTLRDHRHVIFASCDYLKKSKRTHQ